jgi:hypothetical protein
MSEDPETPIEFSGMLHLIKNMLSPRTLPHIIMIALMSSGLLFLVKSQEVFVAMAFISLALAYSIIAIFANRDIVQKLTKLPEEKGDSALIVRFLFSFKITIVPLLLATVLTGIMWGVLGGETNKWISPILASLFIVWSIAQAASFRTGMVEWFANGLGDAKLHSYREKLSTASQIILVQSFAFLIIWIGQMVTESEKMTVQDALLGGLAFLAISIILQAFTIWLTSDEREAAGNEKGMAAFSFKWMVVSQLFITWHAFSIYRRALMNPSDTSTLIEEGLLMAFTVIFAVWSLTTYTVRDGKKLVSENASLPLGISFGYAYAGSVAMLIGTFESLREVMIFGHVLSICAMLLLIRPTLRTSRVFTDIMNHAKTVDITPKVEDSEDEDDSETESSTEEEETWQDDEDLDWEKGTDISKDVEWDADEKSDEKSSD